jgi:hypothetical protein
MSSGLLQDVKDKMSLGKYNKDFLMEFKIKDKRSQVADVLFIVSYLVGFGSFLSYLYHSLRIAFYDQEKPIDEKTRSGHRSSLIVALVFLSLPFVIRLFLVPFGIEI